MYDKSVEPEVYLLNLHPGTHLLEDYLPELGISRYRFAKMLGITQSHLADILATKRGITANIALRLGRLFSQTPEMWLSLQAEYDLAAARVRYGEAIDRIQPLDKAA